MAERRITGGKRPKMVKVQAGQWNEAKRERFLNALAATCNVTAACGEVNMSSASVYRERQRNAAFRAGWAQALAEGYARLEMVMLERAMNGTVKLVERNGVTERVTDYSDRVALQLLRLHKDAAAAEEAAEAMDEDENAAFGARIERQLLGVRRRLGLAEEE